MTDRWVGTFAGRSVAVVPDPCAVLAFKVVGAAAEVVGRCVKAATAVLARSAKTIVHV